MTFYITQPSAVRACPRAGFSLLEVIVAMAIFLMSIAVIGEIVTMGGERALDVEQQSEAMMLCQAKMAEVVAGAQPLSSVSDQSFDETSDYTWSLDASQNDITNLWNVNVTVKRERSDGTKIQAVLSQMVLDPSQRGSSQDSVTISSSGSSGGSGGQGGSASSGSPSSGSQPAGTAIAGSAGRPATPAAGPARTTPSTTAPRTTTPSAAPRTTPSAAPKTITAPAATSKGGR
jgi:type II secretion system protein I